MSCNPFRGGRQIAIAESGPRPEIELPLLCRRCQALWGFDAPRRHADERQRMMGEIKLILQTLGADIASPFYDSLYPDSEATRKVSSVKYDRQLDTPSMVEDIKALQLKLNAANDEDERRALEEDVTGKARIALNPVALVVWDLRRSRRTITKGKSTLSSPRMLLDMVQVVNYIRREGTMRGLLAVSVVNISSADPSDDQANLQRVMYDAGAGISKYKLWLDARAREQAKWSVDHGTMR
ncbi:hypothetical protein EDD16DRAFT_1731098 [Pisolithus croceorrhizus]|nr:hypothetical protein EDD16DRAFT_1731098 [Pisolithus croceorrhizus]